MSYSTPSTRCPVLSVMAAWRTDDGTPQPLRKHLMSVGTQVRLATRRWPILKRLPVAEALELYAMTRRERLPALTQARAVAETMRAFRGLGLLGAVHGPERPAVPRRKKDKDEDGEFIIPKRWDEGDDDDG